MLLQRVITALILLPIVLGIAWFAPVVWVYAIFSLAAALAAHEWAALSGLVRPAAKLAYVLISLAVLLAAWRFRLEWTWFAIASVLWWLAAVILIAGFPENLAERRPGTIALALLGFLLWTPAVLALAMLREMPNGAERLIYLLMLVWAADVGAYLAGRNFGRNRLAPKVSPGKTREGAMGGLLLCLMWAAAAGAYVFEPATLTQWLKVIGLSLAVAMLSIVGDLGISLFKRLSGIKDSGKLLPGHGGILDRVDSLLAAAPAMAFGLWALQL